MINEQKIAIQNFQTNSHSAADRQMGYSGWFWTKTETFWGIFLVVNGTMLGISVKKQPMNGTYRVPPP